MRNHRFLRLLTVLALVSVPTALLAATPAIEVDDPPMGVFADDWYAVMMAGAKSGHMHTTMERLKRDGQDIIRTRNDITMTAGRGETPITITISQTTEETLAGEPLRFTNKLSLGKIPTTTEGRFKDGKVTIISRQFGIATDRKIYDIPAGARMTWGAYREQLDHGLEPGTKYALSLYDPSIAPDRLTTATVEILKKEPLDVFGRKLEAIKTRQTLTTRLLGRDMEVPTTIWLTEEGEAVKLEMMLMDITVQMLACPKAVALAKDEPADIMAGTLIRVEKPLDRDADALSFRLSWPATEGRHADPPETDMQRIVRRGDHEVIITNTRYSARQRSGYQAAGSSEPTATLRDGAAQSGGRASGPPSGASAPDPDASSASGSTNNASGSDTHTTGQADQAAGPGGSTSNTATESTDGAASRKAGRMPAPQGSRMPASQGGAGVSPVDAKNDAGVSPVKADKLPAALSEADRARYTAATPVLNYKDPEVAKLAREAAGDEHDPHRLADKLRRFVSDYIETKNLSVGFATAGEVARSREGDCTEHGVLLAALGRAHGIPTRVVAGFVYADGFLGQRQVFVGHLWTQFYLDGQWVDIDAALHQTDVDPTHIALAVSDAGDNGIADLAGSIWMGKLEINPVERVTSQPAQPKTSEP